MIANAITAARLVLVAPLWLLIVRADDRSRWIALGVFLLAGISDVIDGRIARARGETTRLGAMLDLIADRLLTLSVASALLTAGLLSGLAALAGVMLVARDLVVASYGEALRGKTSFGVGGLERAKIAFQFLALALLIAPPVPLFGLADQHQLGRVMLMVSALLSLVTLIEYSSRLGKDLDEGG